MPYTPVVVADSPSLSTGQERALLDSLLSTHHSLPDLARFLKLSLLDLLDAIASPAIQFRLVALEQAAAHAIRIAASVHLPAVLTALTSTLEAHGRELERLEQRTDPESADLRRHERMNARRAATLVLRLTRFAPLAPDAVLAAIANTRSVLAPACAPSGAAASSTTRVSIAPAPPSSFASAAPRSALAPSRSLALSAKPALAARPPSSHPTSVIPHPTSLLRLAGATPSHGPAP